MPVADGLAPAAIARLNDGGVEVCEQHLSAEELKRRRLGEYDAVIARSATTVVQHVTHLKRALLVASKRSLGALVLASTTSIGVMPPAPAASPC